MFLAYSLLLAAFAAEAVTGVVKDAAGVPLREATVQLLTARLVAVATARSDAQGKFEFGDVPAGDYVLVVVRAGQVERRLPVHIAEQGASLEVVLDPQLLKEEITVTASPGMVETAGRSPQPVTVIDRDEIAARAKSVIAQVANEETGLAWQRTSPTISGIFVRGLTGNKVNVFVDGVRYSTGAMRGGINTFLNLVDPAAVESIEILRGPGSAQYGSDALGGSIQFHSPMPVFSQDRAWHGQWSTFFNSADAGYGSNASASYSRSRIGFLVNLIGHRANTLRTGQGIDSHSSVTRFLGLPSTILYDGRMPDTAFTQYGGQARLFWTMGPDSQWVAHYQRSQQDGGKRFDQLLGGDGNLVADLRNLMFDLFYLRYNKARLGPVEDITASYSYNVQREERVNQGGNGNPLSSINHEPERMRVNGMQVSAGKRFTPRWSLFFGGEYYHERIAAPSYGYSPSSGAFTVRRGRVPDNSRFASGGAWIQNSWEVVPDKFRLVGNLRYSGVSYESLSADSPLVNNRPLWPNDSLTTGDVTFRLGAVATPVQGWQFAANLSRGFRAPHITDLGTLGLTGSGFEVAAPDVAGLGGFVGTTAGADAVSTGSPVEQVKAETSLSYEGSARYRNNRVTAEVTVFGNDIAGNIQKQSLILPAGSVGKLLGSDPITSQNSNGVVFVAASSSPVLVRANFDDVRIAGLESKFEVRPARAWLVGANFTYLHARDKASGLPPNIEGGTPAPNGYLRVRYSAPGARFWIEPFFTAANDQERLSSLDLSDRRGGATRSRSNIANFFQNGATVRGLVRGGLLLATGETLAQVQNRVLGPGVNSAPMFTRLPGYVTLNLRAGWRIGERQNLMLELENLGDRNYRGMSWGIDAPGRGIYLRYALAF